VKIFLDECVDWRLSRHIIGHDVRSARDMGWTGIKNGALLSLASTEFDVFVTVDRNLSFQLNTTKFPISVFVLSACSNRLADLVPLMPNLMAALGSASAGSVTMVSSSNP
jgi:hypothetical protein